MMVIVGDQGSLPAFFLRSDWLSHIPTASHCLHFWAGWPWSSAKSFRWFVIICHHVTPFSEHVFLMAMIFWGSSIPFPSLLFIPKRQVYEYYMDATHDHRFQILVQTPWSAGDLLLRYVFVAQSAEVNDQGVARWAGALQHDVVLSVFWLWN